MIFSRRDMLRSYFSLCLSEDGLVEAVPLLLPEIMPNLDKLPLFLMRLGPQVRAESLWHIMILTATWDRLFGITSRAATTVSFANWLIFTALAQVPWALSILAQRTRRSASMQRLPRNGRFNTHFSRP